MAEQRLTYKIEADESQAVQANTNTVRSLSEVEMAAARMSRGVSSNVDAVTAAIASVGSAARAIRDTTAEIIETAAAYALAVKGAAAYGSTVDALANSYRALRLYYSPTLFTATTLAIGAAAEETLRLAYATGKLSESRVFESARTGLGLRELQELRLASNKAGQGDDFFQTIALNKNLDSDAAQSALAQLGVEKGISPTERLREIGVAFDQITDPVEKLHKAWALFGSDAQTILPYLNSQLDTNIASFRRLGSILSDDESRAFLQFKNDVDAVGRGLYNLTVTPVAEFFTRLSNLAAQAGLALGEVLVTASQIPFFGSPTDDRSPEQRRRDSMTREDFTAESKRLLGTYPQRPDADNIRARIQELQGRRETVLGTYSGLDAFARADELNDEIKALRARVTPSAEARGIQTSYDASLEGLKARLENLKNYRDSSRKALPGYAGDVMESFLVSKIKSLDQEIPSLQARIDALQDPDKLAELITRHQAQSLRTTRESLLMEQATFAKEDVFADPRLRDRQQIAFERARAIDKASTFVDDQGKEQRFRLSQETLFNIERDYVLKLRALDRERFAKKLELSNEAELRRMEFERAIEQEHAAKRGRIFEESEQIQIATIRRAEDFRSTTEQQTREQQLRSLDLQEAGIYKHSIGQKIAVEQAKFGIEQEYLQRVEALHEDTLTRRTELAIQKKQSELRQENAEPAEIENARFVREQNLAEQIAELHQDSDSKVAAARDNAQLASTRLVMEHNQRVFDSIKHASDGLFDSMLSGAKNFGDALRRVLIAGILTPVKELWSNTIASLFTGRSLSSGASAGGGLLGALGLGGGGIGFAGAPGGTSGFSGPVSFGSDATSTILSGIGGTGIGQSGGGGGADTSVTVLHGVGGTGIGGAAGQFTFLAGLKKNLSQLGNIGSGFSTAHGGFTGATGGAMLAGGGILGFDGLRRGGVLGTLEATAGGALIGAKFGGLLGAGIGAAIGLGAGLIRSLFESATDKAREKVKAIYGIDISAKNILEQIVGIAKQGFGGNLDIAIRSPQIRDLVQLYALSTGSGNFGPSPYTPQAASFAQGGGGLSLLPTFSNGRGFFPGGSLQSAGPVINAYFTMPPEAVNDAFNGRTVRVIQDNPRAVAASSQKANQSSFNRRTNTALQISPGTLTS